MIDTDVTTRRLLACGVVAGPLFVAVFAAEGALRQGYDPVRLQVSLLSLGPHGWVQVANFVVTGALMFGFAKGLRRALRTGRGATWAPRLMAVCGGGLIAAGVFLTDPAKGYPSPTRPHPSWHGNLHNLAAGVGFATLIGASLLLAHRHWDRRGFAAYSLVSGLAAPALFAVASVAYTGDNALTGSAGLLQRTAIVLGFAWVSVLAVRLLTSSR